MAIITSHHFKHICINPIIYNSTNKLSDFIKITRKESLSQAYYSDLKSGPDKYFGDAFESVCEIMMLVSNIDKRINCNGYSPAKPDEFGIDGYGAFTRNDGTFGKQVIQLKVTQNSIHYYDSNNSNIINALAAISIFNAERLLFINTGKGIHPELLKKINQNKQLVHQLNYNELVKLLDGNTAFWNEWYNSIT